MVYIEELVTMGFKIILGYTIMSMTVLGVRVFEV